MNTKERLLELFEKNKGTFFSGEEIAKKLSVSRTAVWKAVESLRDDGYCIDAIKNKGYSLSVQTDILSAQGIQKYLEPVCSCIDVEVLPTVESTNTLLRQKAMQGANEGCTIVANNQTGGRGRRGRSFFSPSDSGVYMSLLLKPQKCSSNQAIRFTTMAAVAICEAIEAVSQNTAQIKWVNDIYISGKKVCGILTEASFGLEDGFLEYAILGIGINVSVPKQGFPEEIKDIAGAVFDTTPSDAKNRLAAEVLNRFMTYYSMQPEMEYIEKYKDRSFVIGKEVNVISCNGTQKALVLGIDDECRLMVRYADGKTESLSSGEISIKL